MNVFDVQSAILAKYAQLVAMATMFKKAMATRSLFGMPYPSELASTFL
jgi:hypothetical protein